VKPQPLLTDAALHKSGSVQTWRGAELGKWYLLPWCLWCVIFRAVYCISLCFCEVFAVSPLLFLSTDMKMFKGIKSGSVNAEGRQENCHENSFAM